MGFCLFNTAAIAARHAQKTHGAERVAIVDWDVHHGNGTQDIFWNDPTVLYCSTHQMPLYPGTGAARRDRRRQYRQRAARSRQRQRRVPRGLSLRASCRRSTDFAPDLIIVSAGFDAHHRDPLAEINLDRGRFRLGDRPAARAGRRQFSGNRLVSVLEGGYDLKGLAFSVGAHVGRLMKG